MNTVILQRELEHAVCTCKNARNKAQDAINKLHKLSDYPTPYTLTDVTACNLVAFVEQRVNAVKNTPIYTQAQKDKAIEDWIEWKVKAMPLVAAVENFVNDWQDVNPILDTADMTIHTSDIADSLKPRFTVEIPLQAHRHKELINAVGKAVAELRDWEHEQDTKKLDLKKLLLLTDEELFQSWANSSILVDHSQDDARLIAWRKANNDAIL